MAGDMFIYTEMQDLTALNLPKTLNSPSKQVVSHGNDLSRQVLLY